MADQQTTLKHQLEVSRGYASKRDEIQHRVANLEVFAPVVVAAGLGVLVIELLFGGPGLGILVALFGGAMVVYARLLREVLRRWL